MGSRRQFTYKLNRIHLRAALFFVFLIFLNLWNGILHCELRVKKLSLRKQQSSLRGFTQSRRENLLSSRYNAAICIHRKAIKAEIPKAQRRFSSAARFESGSSSTYFAYASDASFLSFMRS